MISPEINLFWKVLFIVLGEKLCFYKLDVAINTLVDTIGKPTHG